MYYVARDHRFGLNQWNAKRMLVNFFAKLLDRLRFDVPLSGLD